MSIDVISIVVALLVGFFCLLMAGHAFVSRTEAGMGRFVFAPLGIAGMMFAALSHGFTPIPLAVTSGVAFVCAPLSFWGFALDVREETRDEQRWVGAVTAGLMLLTLCVGLTAPWWSAEPPSLGRALARTLSFGPPFFVLAGHLRRSSGAPSQARRFSRRIVMAVTSSSIVGAALALPTFMRTPSRVADPLLWVALAALAVSWVYVAEGRVTVRLFPTRAVTWLLLFVALVALVAWSVRALGWQLDLPRVLLAVVATLFVGIGFVVLGEAVSRGVDTLIAPRTALERELDRARTDVASLQGRLSQMERLALAGELAARVAHEIKNPLAALRGHAEILGELREALPPAPRAQFDRALSIIREESDRIDARVQSLLEVAKPGPRASVAVRYSPRRIATEAVALMEGQARPLTLRVVGADVGELSGDPDAVRSALVNVLRNAIEAQAADGAGAIEVSVTRAADRVCITVTDEGPGLPETFVTDPFVAFRTTKAGGHGLGLVIARAAIASGGGVITFAPNTPRGTRVSMELPDTTMKERTDG